MIDVLFITNVPSPYRVDFFNELGKRCRLTVVFQKTKSTERKGHWDRYNIASFNGIFLDGKSINTDSSISFGIRRIIRKYQHCKIIVCGFSSPTNIIAIHYLKKHKIPFYIEIDGGSPWLSDGKLSFKEKIKKAICSGATGYFSSCKSGDEYLIRYGALKERIYRYSFTSLFAKDISNKAIDAQAKAVLKKVYGLSESKCVLTIGRFTYQNGFGKGFDLFVEIASRFSCEDIGFYIIGDEPTQYFLQLKKDKELSNLHFLPFYAKDKLFDLYKCADLTMILSRGDVWGLVVNESLANGVPVISSDLCLAGRELIKNGINGYVVELDNLDNICAKVKEIIEKNGNYQENCLKSIRNYTFENMVEEHIKNVGAQNENLH